MGAGTRIKEILREKGMTIKQLAELSGVSVNTLYSITKRDSKHIDETILQKIADALGVRPLYIMSFEGLDDERLDDVSAEINSVLDEVRDSIGTGNEELAKRTDEDLTRLKTVLSDVSEARDRIHIEDAEWRRAMLLSAFNDLSEEGQKVAVMRLKELAEHPKYMKK